MTLSVKSNDIGPEWLEIQPGTVQYRHNPSIRAWQFRYYDIAIDDAVTRDFETLTDMLRAILNRSVSPA